QQISLEMCFTYAIKAVIRDRVSKFRWCVITVSFLPYQTKKVKKRPGGIYSIEGKSLIIFIIQMRTQLPIWKRTRGFEYPRGVFILHEIIHDYENEKLKGE
ncbi:hypothetical protein ACJX0J_040025, partial [Zea mays]